MSSATPKFLKLCCGKNTRKIKYPRCFDELVLESIRIFPELKSLSKNNELIFFYIDDEKEIIQIASKEDFEIAMQSDPIPTRLYTGSQVSDVTQSILESEKVKQKLKVSSMVGEGIPPLSFRQENSYYQGSECSKVLEEERDLDELSSFSLVGHSDARVNAAQLIRMQSSKKKDAARKPSNLSDLEIQALRDQMTQLKVSDPQESKENEKKVAVDFNQNTEIKELKTISVNTSAKVMNEVAMQSSGVEQSDKMCEQKPELVPIALDALPPIIGVDKASSPSHQQEQKFEVKEKRKHKSKKLKKEKVLKIIDEEIQKRVPVIFKQLFEIEMEKRKGNHLPEDTYKAIHKNICCDECGSDPIVGIRYKSIIQKNYDLCSICEATIEHPHALLKITRPELAPSSLIVYKQEHDQPVEDLNFKNEDDGKFFKRFDVDVRQGKNQEADRIKQMNIKKPDENSDEAKKVEKELPAAPSLQNSKHPIGGAWGRTGLKKGPNQFYKCRYVKEYPDGEQPVSPGQLFEKTFTLRNDGKEAWPETTQLCHVGGDYFGFLSQKIGAVEAGKQIEVKLSMFAPEEQGRYTGYLRMCERHNEARFGHRFWCTVFVKKDQPPKKQLQNSGIEEFKIDENAEKKVQKNIESPPPESAFSEYQQQKPLKQAEKAQVSAIEKDYRFAMLSDSLKTQVINLYLIGEADIEKIFTLINKHKQDINLVANELFQSNA